MKKLKITKGFCLWMIIGIVLYGFFTSAFVILSNSNTCQINIHELASTANQIIISSNNFTTTDSDPQFYFTNNLDFKTDYLDINASDINTGTMYAQLFYSDEENSFNEGKSVRFTLTNGLNEIKITPAKYYRLDPDSREGVSFTLNKITLRSAVNPIYEIPQGFILFVLAWWLLYFTAVYFGIHYTGIRNGIVLLLETLFTVFLSLTLIFALDNIEYKTAVLIFLPLTCFVIAYLYTHTEINAKKLKIFSLTALLLMIFLLCYVGWQTLSVLGTDLGQVYYSAWDIVETGRLNTEITGTEVISSIFTSSNNDYFVRYQTNMPILLILASFYKAVSLLGLTAGDLLSNYAGVLLNAVFITVSVIFGAFSAKNIFGKRGFAAYILMSVLFVPYYVHVNRFYTDTISMPFTALAFYIYTCPDNRFKSKYIKYILAGIAIGVGSVIKGSLFVIIVAAAIHLLLMSVKNLRYVLIVFAAVIAVSASWGIYTKNCSWIDMSENETIEFPLTHWIMMGLNRDAMGGYVQSDMEFTQSFNTKKEKQKENVDEIRKRLGEFNSIGDFADYEFSKAALTWGDGQYMQSAHIQWGLNQDGIYKWIVASREYYPIYNIYILIYNFCMYIFAVAGGALNLKRSKTDYGMFLRLTMLGVMFFFMMWESKSRYILNFTPVFMIAAICGLEEIRKLFLQKNTVNNKNQYKKRKKA